MVFDNQFLKNGRVSQPNEHTRVSSADIDSRSLHAPPRGGRFCVNVGLTDLADVGVCDVTPLLCDDGLEVRVVRRYPGHVSHDADPTALLLVHALRDAEAVLCIILALEVAVKAANGEGIKLHVSERFLHDNESKPLGRPIHACWRLHRS